MSFTDNKKDIIIWAKKTIKFNLLMFLLLALISAGPINQLLSEIPLLHFEDLRNYFILFETDGELPAPQNMSLFEYHDVYFGFRTAGFYLSMIVSISLVYVIFSLFADGFMSIIFILVALCVINNFVFLAINMDIPFITAIQAILGPKILLIIGVIYRFAFCER